MAQTINSPSSTRASESAQTVAFLERIFPSPRDCAIRLWDGTTLPAANGAPRQTLVFKSPGTLRRMGKPPIGLSAAEAYVRGEFDVEGDIFSLLDLINNVAAVIQSPRDAITFARGWQSLPSSQPMGAITRGPAHLSGALHSKARDKAAIQYHYDVGNDFYALFLGRNMVYSCAYFPTGNEDLDAAQDLKLDMICRKLRLQPGERLLDIGCGWGGLAMFAAQHYGARVLGVTLSEKQHALANQRIRQAGLGDAVEIKLIDYRDLGDESFDKLVSIGMFEHVGRSHLPEYFAHAFRLLKPGGAFLNHGISRRMSLAQSKANGFQQWVGQHIVGTGEFGLRYIFPDGDLTPVSEVNALAEAAGFEVRDVENWREHYALTLRHWVNRLDVHRAEAIRLTDETVYRTWRLYMAGSAWGFDTGRVNVNQTLLAKLDGGRSGMPMSRADWYAG